MSTIDISELEKARRESKHCQICEGVGLVVCYHPQYQGVAIMPITTGELDEDDKLMHRMTAVEVSAHCTCSLGRWMRFRVDDETRRRIPDVAAILAGISLWQFDNPYWDAQERRGAAVKASDVKSIGRSMATRLGANEAA